MRIGLTCTTIEPAIVHGKIDGIGTYTKNLYEAYLANGHDITPISFPNAKQKILSGYPKGKFLNLSYSLATLTSLLNPTSLALNGKLKKHIDLLHSTDHMVPRIHDVPVVATICDAIMFRHSDWHWKNIRFANLKKWMRKKTLHWADHYITISNTMVTELVEYIGIKPEKISVVYLGINPFWYEKIAAAQKKQVLAELNLPEKFILFTGTLQPKKNLPRIIEAYLQLPADIQDEYPLVIAGRAGHGCEPSLQAIEELTSLKKGYWLDYVTLPQLRVLFQSTALYIHPSLHEGFGLTLLEAFASEAPVITSSLTALPEIAGGAAYLIDPYSVNEIPNAIKTVLTHPGMQEELIAKGQQRAQEFSWEKCAAETLKIYSTLL